MTDYRAVPTIVDALIAEGRTPSADRVRAQLGSGSNETIGKLIKGRLRELGRLPQEDMSRQAVTDVPYRPPELDAALVANHVEMLRGETAYQALTEHLQVFAASYQALMPLVQPAMNWIYRQANADDSTGRVLVNSSMWMTISREAEIAARRAESVLAELQAQAAPKPPPTVVIDETLEQQRLELEASIASAAREG